MFIYYLHKKNKYQKSRNSLCVCLFCGNSDLYQLFSKRSYVRFHEYEETNHLIRGVGARMAYTLLTAAITFTFFWGTDMGFVCRVGVDGWIQREMCFFCEWIFATDACMHAMSRFSSCYDTVIY